MNLLQSTLERKQVCYAPIHSQWWALINDIKHFTNLEMGALISMPSFILLRSKVISELLPVKSVCRFVQHNLIRYARLDMAIQFVSIYFGHIWMFLSTVYANNQSRAKEVVIQWNCPHSCSFSPVDSTYIALA